MPILFHFYRDHENQLPSLRAWLTAYMLDSNNSGYARISEISKKLKIKEKHLKTLFRRSYLFIGTFGNKVYFLSHHKILAKHHLS